MQPRFVALLVLGLFLAQTMPAVADAPVSLESRSLFEDNAKQDLLCYINTGLLENVSVETEGGASSFIVFEAGFNETLQVSTGSASYNVTIPRGEYGSSMIVLGIADNLSYPGTGGRLLAILDTGHNESLNAVRLRVLTYFDGNASGLVWYRVDLEWSNSTGPWASSTVFYNVSVEEESMDTGFQVFFARGRYLRLNITMVWLPDTGNMREANAYILVLVDHVVSLCWPLTPWALVEYRVYTSYAEANITLPTGAGASSDYYYRIYRIVFPVNTSLAMATVNLTPPLEIDEYTLALALDENGNPLPFKVWDDGNVSIVMPTISQNITLVYLENGRGAGASWLPPDGLIWFYDFGDAVEQEPTSQGWLSYGSYYARDVTPEPVYGDYSLHTRLTASVWLASGGWYRRDLVLPPGDYTALVNVRVEYRYWSVYGYTQLIFYYREYDGTYRLGYLLNGRYTVFDDTVRAELTAQKWGNQVYLTVRSRYASAGSQVWIRWAVILGVPSTGYNASLESDGFSRLNTTIETGGLYYLLLPYTGCAGLEVYDANETLGYASIEAGGSTSLVLCQESSVRVELVSAEGVDQYYLPETLVTAPGAQLNVTVRVSGPELSSLVLPDPPLEGVPVLFALSRNGSVLSNATSTSGSGGLASATVQVGGEPGVYNLTVVPLQWPYVVPSVLPVYAETVTVMFYGPDPIYMRRNETLLEGLHAEYTFTGLPFNGVVNVSVDGSTITAEPVSVEVSNGYGELYVYSGGASGRNLLFAVEARTSNGLIFEAFGEKSVIVVGARIIIRVEPSGPPWFVYEGLTWRVEAVYDDGSPAEGSGWAVVEVDHYRVDNVTFNGSLVYTLESAGYVNYLNVTFVEPLVGATTNYSLVQAVQRIAGGGNWSGGGVARLGGVELVSFEIETLQEAALKDGVLAVAFIGLTLLPYILRRYLSFFNGPAGLLIWTGILLGLTLMTMIGRVQIPVNVYIVETSNGTTLEPVYQENPFARIYVAPMMIQLMVIIHNTVELISRTLWGARRW